MRKMAIECYGGPLDGRVVKIEFDSEYIDIPGAMVGGYLIYRYKREGNQLVYQSTERVSA
jgi:hypothetical protein